MRASFVRWTGAIAVALVLVAGCAREPDAKEAKVDADESRSAVIAQVKEAATALTQGEVTVGELTGGFQRCGGGELSASQVRYTAGGAVTGGTGTLSERIVAAVRALRSAGWDVKKEGTTPQGVAYGRLTRGGLELSVDRDQLKGSNDFVMGVGGPCFEVTDAQADELTARDKDRIRP